HGYRETARPRESQPQNELGANRGVGAVVRLEGLSLAGKCANPRALHCDFAGLFSRLGKDAQRASARALEDIPSLVDAARLGALSEHGFRERRFRFLPPHSGWGRSIAAALAALRGLR